jgi:hypothetical protein
MTVRLDSMDGMAWPVVLPLEVGERSRPLTDEREIRARDESVEDSEGGMVPVDVGYVVDGGGKDMDWKPWNMAGIEDGLWPDSPC